MKKPQEPIAITGMACRLPGTATSLDGYWDVLSQGQTTWSKIPKDRFNQEAFFDPDSKKNGTFHTQGGHFLDQDISKFDATFFNINPAEAKAMDPQVRLLLEVAYEAFENAGATLDDLRGTNTSSYVALYNRDYEKMLLRDPENLPFYYQTGNGEAMFANRLSYFFDLKGASLTLDTGCSGSMVALHQACESIRNGESVQSIVGASNLVLDPAAMIGPSFLKFYASDGRSKAFDHRADGYGRGEGVCCVVLKSLSAALENGDPIQAVIRSSVINQDGRTAGITVPSGSAQESLIRTAYQAAGLSPADTAYVETHGSGTALGDLTEIKTIGSVFGEARDRHGPVRVGSAKTNIGHLENASGLASIIKAVMVVSKGYVPPSLNLQRPSTDIQWEEWNVEVEAQGKPLCDSGTGSSQVSLNSFGFGGTNVHVILDQLQEVESQRDTTIAGHGIFTNGSNGTAHTGNPYVFALSARSNESARSMASQLQRYLLKSHGSENNTSFPETLAHTLYHRRSLLPWRTAFVADSTVALQKVGLESLLFQHSGKGSNVGFVFTGQGAQWATMGCELLETDAVFRDSILKAEKCLSEFGVDWKLVEELSKLPPGSRLDSAVIAQPSSTAIQLAIVDMLESWNVRPAAVTGHSSGEIPAAYASKAVSFRDAMLISYARGCAAGRIATYKENVKGAMMAVGLSAQAVEPYISRLPATLGLVSVACVNSPDAVTISGDQTAVIRLQETLQQEGVFVRRLPVDVAYHSHHMLHVAGDYKDAMASLSSPRSNPDVAFHSSVEGKVVNGTDLDANYWVKNMVSPVRFSTAIDSVAQNKTVAENTRDINFLIEIGPHSALKGPIKQTLKHRMSNEVQYAPTLVRKRPARQSMLELASELFKHGYDVDMGAVNFGGEATQPRRCLSDLPPYPWDHSTSFWHESRLSRNYRYRTDPPHEILGTLSPESSRLEPRWRNYISTSALPWLAGHKIEDEIIFPAAAYMSMAFEAGHRHQKGILGQHEGYSGIQLHNVSFGRSLVIPESGSGVEVMFVLRPASEQTGRDLARRHEFTIYSNANGQDVVDHCHGFISVLSKKGGTPSLGNEINQNRKLAQIDVDRLYSELDHFGIRYTDAFRALTTASAARGYCSATVDTPEVAKSYNASIHPTTIDACLQTIFPGIRSIGNIGGPVMPTFIQVASLLVAGAATPNNTINVLSCLKKSGAQRYRADIETTGNSGDILLSLKQLEATSIRVTPMKGEDSERAKACQKVVMALDPDFLPAEDIQKICTAPLSPTSVAHWLSKIAQACRYYANIASQEITPADMLKMTSYQRQYLAWIQGLTSLHLDHIDPLESHCVDKLLQEVESSGSEGEMITRIGRNLTSILRGQDDPLALMVNNNLLYRLYQDDESMQRCALQAAEYAKMLSQKSPFTRVLEIGAGTGGATLPILKAMTASGRLLCEHYCFTDVSAGFFPNAEQKLAEWKDLMSFRKLNIEDSPADQGFEPASYDLVIAANVLHATKYAEKTTKNVRSLLKPGGKLVLLESTRPTIHRSFIFGTLPGWWVGSMERNKDSPLLSVDEWHNVLQRTDFSGVDVTMHSYETPEEQTDSLLISTAAPAVNAHTSNNPISVVLSERKLCREAEDGALGSMVADDIVTSLGAKNASISSLGDPGVKDKVCIFLTDLEGPTLSSLDDHTFDALKNALLSAKEVIWVTLGATEGCESPQSALFLGLARVLRRESAHIKITTLDLDSVQRSRPQALANSVLRFLQKRQSSEVTNDFEWTERDGRWLVPRTIPNEVATEFVHSHTNGLQQGQHQLEKFGQHDRALCLATGHAGTLQDLHFMDNTQLEYPLAADEVEIEVKASGVNFRDVMVSLGQMPDEMVAECSGVVVGVGKQLQQSFLQGDRVYTWHVPRYASRVRSKGSLTRPIPHGASFEEAATVPIIYSTAYHSLVNIARLEPGETVLIHSGAGGVGQAAITLALRLGAVIFTTVGSEDKKALLIEKYGLRSSHIFSSRSSDFASQIRNVTQGAGVDVVLNALTGSFLQHSIDLLAPFGRFVEIGKSDIMANARMDMGNFSSSKSFAAFDLVELVREKPAMAADILSQVHRLFQTGVIKQPFPLTVSDISHVADTFRLMQKGEHVGKLVVSHTGNSEVKVTPRKPRAFSFYPDATYLIVGGQGGLGRTLCPWMAQCGAKSIVILSPSGSKKPATQALIQEVADLGAQIHALPCDTSDRSQLAATLAKCHAELPPIRGIIHAGLDLRDSSFENMSAENFRHVLRPKVSGTYNLHGEFQNRPPLDFFVMLSSYVGLLGSTGQANYAAASTFQDAFAQWRTNQGLPTHSIDLGTVQGAGYLHEKPESVAHFERLGLGGISLEAFHALVGYAISTCVDNSPATQTAIGWAPPPTWTHSTYKELDPRFSHLRPQVDSLTDTRGSNNNSNNNSTSPVSAEQSLSQVLANSNSQEDVLSAISTAISQQVVSILGVAIEDIDLGKSIAAYGGDSLVAVEFRNWFRKELKCTFTTDQISSGYSVHELASIAAKVYTGAGNEK